MLNSIKRHPPRGDGGRSSVDGEMGHNCHGPSHAMYSEAQTTARCGSFCDSGISLNSYRTSTDSITLESINSVGESTSLAERNFNRISDCGLKSEEDQDLQRKIKNLRIDSKQADCIDKTDYTSIRSRVDSLQDEGLCRSIQEEELLGFPQAYVQDADGDTICHLAIVQNPAYADSIICRAPSWDVLNLQNELGQTPLHLAALTDQPYLCRQLVIHGITLDIRDRNGNTALHLSCRRGSLACVQALTRPITNTEVQQVHYSVPFQKVPQDQAIQNYEGETCLQLAASGNHIDIMRHLVDACGANVNEHDWKSGRTILHRAVESQQLGVVEFLLQQPGIDVNVQTYEGYTALQLAVGRRSIDLVQLLMLAGAEDAPAQHSSDDASDTDSDQMDSTSTENDDGYDDFEFCGQAITIPK